MPLASINPDQGWFSRERVLLLTLGLATLLALYLCYLIVQPFIPAVAIAVAAAVATKRPQNWLARRLRSRTAASAAGVLLVAGFIVIPLSLLITYLVRQIIVTGIVTYSQPHAEERMRERGISTVDCINVLRGGVADEGEYENGSWRYRVRTPKMCVVIRFESESLLEVVTAWREK